jgi:glycosyltransferase involved in cell wall biosynthesis
LDAPCTKDGIYRILDVRTDFNGYRCLSEKMISLFYNPRNYSITRDLIEVLKPDIASVWSISGISTAPLFALQRARVPYVVHLFDRCLSFVRKNGWKRAINPLLYDRLDLDNMVSCSESLKKDYVKQGFSEGAIQVIPHGINPRRSLPRRKSVDPRNTRILFVGQLWEAKGADLAIQAIRNLKERDIHAYLTIVGDGDKKYISELKGMIGNQGLVDEIKFAGRIPRKELTQFYREHDIFIFPTHSWYKEPFGIVILEAMNQGIPVIASNCGGPVEIITDKENGLLFPPGNAESLSLQIEGLINSPKLIEKVRNNAFRIIKSDFHIQHIGARTLSYYNSILDAE